MKSIFTTIAFSLALSLCIGTSAFAVPVSDAATSTTELSSEFSGITLEQMKTITPKEYTELTGKKLNFKQVVALKYTQHKLQKSGQDPIGDDKVLMILLAILIPPVAVYLLHDDITKDFWINVILTLLCGLPGIIHALILVSKRFK